MAYSRAAMSTYLACDQRMRMVSPEICQQRTMPAGA
jgi:hypothetical protein